MRRVLLLVALLVSATIGCQTTKTNIQIEYKTPQSYVHTHGQGTVALVITDKIGR